MDRNGHGRYLRAGLDRRGFLAGAGALALLAPLGARGQGRLGQVRDLRGDVRISGRAAEWTSPVRAGDVVETGPDGSIIFVVAHDAVWVRGGSRLELQGAASSTVVAALRVVTGAVAAVFQRGRPRTVYTPTVTAGIRGTGVFVETRGPETYFCTCFGVVELVAAGDERELVESEHHAARLVGRADARGTRFATTQLERHTDAEMDLLEQVVGRRAPWFVR